MGDGRDKTPDEIRKETDEFIRARYEEADRIVAVGEDDLPEYRMAKEVQRLRGIMSEQARLRAELDQVQAENRELRQYHNLEPSDKGPAAAATLHRVREDLEAMVDAHRREFERVRELENARLDAINVLESGLGFKAMQGRALGALRTVPDCALCRDKPGDGGCTRCRRGVNL